MKKYVKLFIIAMAILFIMPNVNAREFKINDINFSVEGVKINLYELTTESETGDLDMTKIEKYVKRQPTKTVDIDVSKLNYHPKYKTVTINDDDSESGETSTQIEKFVDIDLNITKEFLSSYLSTDMENTSEERAYIFDVVLVLKTTNVPNNVKTIGLTDSDMRTEFADRFDITEYTGVKIIDTNNSFEYAISGGSIIDKEIEYETSFSGNLGDLGDFEDMGDTASIYDNISSIYYTDYIDIRDAADNTIFGLAIIDIEDFNEFVDYEANLFSGEVTASGDVEEVTYETIPVPNTALDFSKLIYVLGYLLLIGGAYILLRFKTKKGTN